MAYRLALFARVTFGGGNSAADILTRFDSLLDLVLIWS
jgi:hypothetical protein